MDAEDLNDLEAAINLSMPSEAPEVVERICLGRFPVRSTDQAQSRSAASSSTVPVDNQQEALLSGMVGTPEEHIAALRMATTQMLQESTPERVAEIANIFRPPADPSADPRIAAIARHGYPEPEMPLNAPLPYKDGEHHRELDRTDEEIYGGHVSDAD